MSGKKKSVKEENLQEISAAKIIRTARKAKNETETLRGKLEPGRKEKKLKQSQRLAIAGVKKIRKEEEVSEESNPRIPRKKINLLTLRSILIFILMKIQRELFMDLDLRMLRLQRHL